MKQQKKGFLTLAAGVAAAALGSSAFAAPTVMVTDNFDSYTNGTLSGQGGWTTPTPAATPIQVAGGTDKYAAVGSSGQDEYKPFSGAVPHTDGESITTTFNVTLTSAQSAGDYFLHLSNPAGTTSNFYERIFARSSTNGFQFGLVDTSGTGSTPTYGTTELSLNTDYTVSVVWNFVAGALNDTFSMTVNGAPYLTHTWTSTTGAEPTALAAVNLRQGSGTAAPTAQVDDISVVASAVPEPASLAAGAVVGVLALGRRRRAR